LDATVREQVTTAMAAAERRADAIYGEPGAGAA
jgi:hypothetical protein